MFFLSLIEHKLRFPPADLSLPLHKGIKKFLDGIFLDRVILNLGRCVSIYDIRNIYGGFIHAGEGAPTYTVSYIVHLLKHDLQYRVDSLMISMCQLISFPNHAIKFQILIADLKWFRVLNVSFPPLPIEHREKPFALMLVTVCLDVGDLCLDARDPYLNVVWGRFHGGDRKGFRT
ncbi:unnamed protein product [Linum tenue]|uniref:RNA polymerase Rpb7-like N-terminal domain-containing protein n=1 Tax=Linum tenue TaxID=586396 RepID=A0AAV0NP73_9ROSI|nr:unnamed protein product [Linum tenue]CAI0460423.1 unnamed protein product [Linum tenue]CAI0556797.1 unnamed protein product [Linum tenue]